MLADIKYFFKHTAVYSLSNIVAKAAGFFLIPIYTNSAFLSPADFGLFGIIDISLTIAAEILVFGQGNSILMFNNADEYKEKKESSFFTITIFIFAITLFFLALFLFAAPLLSSFFSKPDLYANYLRWSGLIIFFRIINNILLSKLRADEKSYLFTATNAVKIALSLGLTIFFLVYMKLGIQGILYSFFISEVAAFIVVIPGTSKAFLKSENRKFDKKIISVAFKFGFPLALGSIGSLVLNLSDRYILKYFTDFRTVAIYDLGYRLAGVLNMFIVIPFSLTLLPAAFKVFGKENDKRYFTKLMTYLTFTLVWLGLIQALFSEEFIMFFTNDPIFKFSYPVVPIITFAYIFSGIRLVASLGLYFTKNTKYIALLIISAGILNIVLNFIFIPIYGMQAAAYNTVIAFILFHISTQILANKYYPIPFENLKVLTAIFIGLVLFLAVYLMGINNIWLKIAAKIAAVIIFPFVLFLLNFYEKREIETIKNIFIKWRNPAKWLENLKNFNDEN